MEGDFEMGTIADIKAAVLQDFFIKKSQSGDALHIPSFVHNNGLLGRGEILKQAVAELVSDGVVDNRDNGVFLTEKGVQAIYPESSDQVIEKVGNDILNCFGGQIGDAFNKRSFTHDYFMNYNPKEKASIEAAMSLLADQGCVEDVGNALLLTEKGMKKIRV